MKLMTKFPLDRMYVTWGWCIMKNNLIDADYSMAINDFDDEEDKFMIEDHFFSDTVFHAKNINNRKGTTSVITVDYCLGDKKKPSYFIELWIYNGKEKVPFYTYEKGVKNIEDLVTELNFLFLFISTSINDSTFDFNQDLNDLLIADRKYYCTNK